MIEVLKMLKYSVRLYMDKLFQLMLNPRILLLILKVLEQQANCRVWAKLLHGRGGELGEHDESYGDGGGSKLTVPQEWTSGQRSPEA